MSDEPSSGGGDYSDVGHMARMLTQAEGIVLIVFNGERGNGISVVSMSSRLSLQLPDALRRTADHVEGDLRAKGRKKT